MSPARNGRQFTEVHGRWEVPAVAIPSGRASPEFRSSIWIGLDGQRRYFNSVPAADRHRPVPECPP